MKFKDLYERGLDRKVNPAVSASDLSDDTVRTEIVEYVFTKEIVKNLYTILSNIKENQGSHIGIWINGYYGSGKSHFLKYASYCLSAKKEYRDMAFERLIEATREIMPCNNDQIDPDDVSISNLEVLQKWYVEKANVEMIMFNIGDVHNANAATDTTFTNIFWNQFNAQRGYNSFYLALAQYLEKALDDVGKFNEFKQHVRERGYDWERNISRFAAGRLDLALTMAKEVDPELATDVIRTKIMNNDVNLSVESFAQELKQYIDRKNDRNFRIIFFVDEVSQFIGEHPNLILQLQSLVKRVDEVCKSKVWIACTAQQTLEDVVSAAGGSINDPNDQIGKILGRFEVRASLQGTSPEYITQKRILDKKGEVEVELAELYEKDKAKLEAQFVLPSTYQSYKDKENFAAFYPFVPYQFQLIMKVLDSFVNMNYVDKQVKGNERSLLNITFSIVKETANCEVGKFIPFDKFFGPMFQGSMQHLGQRAIENARQALDMIQDKEQKEFYRRVIYVLFMVCNLSDSDKQTFSATIDNIVTLLMTKVDASKAAIKNDVAKVLDFLMDKSVIRKIRTDAGAEIYDFYTEEESQVAQIIKNQQVDSNTYSDELHKIIYNHFGFDTSSNKETFYTRSFNVGGNVDGRTYLSNNADVVVDFLTNAFTDLPEQFAFTNMRNHLVFFLYPQFHENEELRHNFLDYCRVQKFAQEPAISEERQRTKQIFQNRARELYNKEILPKFQQILDTCPVISGQNILSAAELGQAKKKDRYKAAMNLHMSNLYEFAKLVSGSEFPKSQSELSDKILRNVDPMVIPLPLTTAEKKVKDFLDRAPHDVTVADITHQFAKVPYGWSDYASIHVVNELVRRHLYAFNYNNNPNVTREETARHIVKEANKFTVEPAKAIPQEILNDFIEAWKHIFNVMTVVGSNDETELYRNCKETEDSALNKLLKNYRKLSKDLMDCPFVGKIDEAISMMEEWLAIRDHKDFFTTITDAKDVAGQLFDECKNINQFSQDQYEQYKKVKTFLNENKDNFAFLPETQKEAVNKLKGIAEDMTPWDTLPSYMKMKRNLEGQLGECKKRLIQKVTDSYNKVFDELDEYAKSTKVSSDKYARRDSTILRKTNTSNFYALQANADTTSFYEEQMALINNAIVTPNPQTPPTSGGEDIKPTPQTQPIPRKRKIVHLNTHTSTPMRTEEDVDLYLKSLKAELMQYIGGDCDIIIS